MMPGERERGGEGGREREGGRCESELLCSSLTLCVGMNSCGREEMGRHDRTRPLGRTSHRWEDNVKMDLK